MPVDETTGVSSHSPCSARLTRMATTCIIGGLNYLVGASIALQALRLIRGSHRLGKLPMQFGDWQSGEWTQPTDVIVQNYGPITSEPMEVGDVL